jgi:putative intracellular protease/amidase
MSQYMPFMLETSLTKNGAKFEKASEAWGAKVVTSGQGGRLLTGQNPASAGPLAKAVLAALPSVK